MFLWGSSLLILVNSDAFAGGFLAGVVEGKSLDESIDMGHWLASLSIKELGPQYVHSVPPDRHNLSFCSIIYKDIKGEQATPMQHSPPVLLQWQSK